MNQDEFEEGRSGAKKQRYHSPSMDSEMGIGQKCEIKKKGMGESSKHTKKCPNFTTHNNTQTSEETLPQIPKTPSQSQPHTQIKIKNHNLLSPRKVGEKGDEAETPPSRKHTKTIIQKNGKGYGREGEGGLDREEAPTNQSKSTNPPPRAAASPATSQRGQEPSRQPKRPRARPPTTHQPLRSTHQPKRCCKHGAPAAKGKTDMNRTKAWKGKNKLVKGNPKCFPKLQPKF